MDNWTFSFGKYKSQPFKAASKDVPYIAWIRKVTDEADEDKINNTFVKFLQYVDSKH